MTAPAAAPLPAPGRPSTFTPSVCLAAFLLVAPLACGRPSSAGRTGRAAAAGEGAAASAPAAAAQPYPVSAEGGTPMTGPGIRYNSCERIWCLTHRENFFIDHFLPLDAGGNAAGGEHVGWIMHDDLRGDVFVPRWRNGGPPFPDARATVLLLCGHHVHPYLLGKWGGPIRHTGYNHILGYGRGHFDANGTRLDPCCINGLGFGYIHSMAGRQFRFHDLQEYRQHPELGWQKPFVARVTSAAR